MADRASKPGGEWKWVIIAIAIILVGVVVGVLHRMNMVPLWASTLATVLMAVGAIAAALAAARAARESGND